MTTIPIQNNPMEMSIRVKLTNQFSPVHLDIFNESYMHNVPKGSETHFKVLVVSSKFENKPLLQVSRHLQIYISRLNFDLIFRIIRGTGW